MDQFCRDVIDCNKTRVKFANSDWSVSIRLLLNLRLKLRRSAYGVVYIVN